MNKKRYLTIIGLAVIFSCALSSTYSTAEMDKTRKMKAEAEYHFEEGQYYKAIDIWAEVLKIDSYDNEAIEGISKAQKILGKKDSEKRKRERRRLQKLIQEGKNYSRDRKYKEALSSWGQALSIDPTNKEVLDLIEEARIKAQYQISILDKLDQEKRLKTPHIYDLEKMAKRMIDLLEKANIKARKERAKEIKKEVKKEVEEEVEDAAPKTEEEFIKTTFSKGEEFYKEGRFKDAISEWNKILPHLPKSSEITVKIAELKERITAEEKKAAEEELKRKEEAKRQAKTEEAKDDVIAKSPDEVGTTKQSPKEIVPVTPAPRNNKIIIGIVALLVLLLIVKIVTRSKVKPHPAKAPPKKTKKEEFEPRDLKKFLKKEPNQDKDLFK